MLQELMDYERELFNNLSPVELADTKMRDREGLNIALLKLGPLFAKHNVSDKWGISLLHNHWFLEEGELPMQEVNISDGRKELITLPKKESLPKVFWPSVLAVIDGPIPSLKPLEFSVDPGIHEANRILMHKPEFIQDFCNIMIENNLETTFALCVLRIASSANFEFVEFNYEGRISVLKETVPAEIEGKKLIQTSWGFTTDASGIACESSCFSQCVVSGSGSHTHRHPKAHNPNA